MTNEEKQVLERAGVWAQAMQDVADAGQGVERSRSSDDARTRISAEVDHRWAVARFGEAELALLDAVRAVWAQNRMR